MTERRTTTIVPYCAAQMFALVADIEKYPEFLPWCLALRVVERDVKDGSGSLTAEMVVAYKVFRERFRSRVFLNREAGAINADYLDGPFRSLQNRWRFADRPEGGSTIDFKIAFELKNLILQATAKNVFDKAFSRMSEAFIKRAKDVYGRS